MPLNLTGEDRDYETERYKRHRCFGKIKWIMERYRVWLSHDEIVFLCEEVLKAVDEADFYRKLQDMEKEKGEAYVKALLIKLKARKKALEATEKYLTMYT